jgi:hypothetical protein
MNIFTRLELKTWVFEKYVHKERCHRENLKYVMEEWEVSQTQINVLQYMPGQVGLKDTRKETETTSDHKNVPYYASILLSLKDSITVLLLKSILKQ